MIRSQKLPIPKQKLFALLQREGCELQRDKNGAYFALVPGWDQHLTGFATRWPVLQCFWDRLELIETRHDQATAQQLRLRYWTWANIGIHALLSSFALLEVLHPKGLTTAQFFLFLGFVNLLPASTTWLQAKSLFRRLESLR